MILDALARFSNAVATTTSVASTDVIDTLAAGDSYQGAWFVCQVTTSFTTNTAVPTFTFQLQTSDVEGFTGASPATMVASAAFLASQLTAGKFWAARIPMNAKRYLRGYKVVSTNTGADFVTASGLSQFIVADIDKFIGANQRYML